MSQYDVCIIGTGPAGMFAALEIIKLRPKAKIVMLEKGPIRPMGDKSNVTSGWGGAGAFSDGKLNLTSVVGGTIHEVIGQEAYDKLMAYVDQTYLKFGGNPNRLIDASKNKKRWEKVRKLETAAYGLGLTLKPFPIRHLGTDTAHDIVMRIRKHLLAHGVEIRTDCPVQSVTPKRGAFWVVCGDGGDNPDPERLKARFVLAAPGRVGAEWMASVAHELGLKLHNNGIDVGVRVEVPNATLREIADLLYESKLSYRTKYDHRLRTFCMCPSGYVAIENYRGLRTVNGHSYEFKKSPNTNFAVLATDVFTDPFNDPLGFGKDVSGIANKLAGGGVLVQRLGDFRNGRRSKAEKMNEWEVQPTLPPPDAIPGDLGKVIPYWYMAGIIEFLEVFDKIAPGVASNHTLLYGIEVKFYSNKIETVEGFETKVSGLYVAGDGSGYTRGLNQSSMQGVIVARHLAERLK